MRRPWLPPLIVVVVGLGLVVGGAQLLGHALGGADAQVIGSLIDADVPAPEDGAAAAGVTGAIQGVLAIVIVGVGVLTGGIGLFWALMAWRRSRVTTPES